MGLRLTVPERRSEGALTRTCSMLSGQWLDARICLFDVLHGKGK